MAFPSSSSTYEARHIRHSSWNSVCKDWIEEHGRILARLIVLHLQIPARVMIRTTAVVVVLLTVYLQVHKGSQRAKMPRLSYKSAFVIYLLGTSHRKFDRKLLGGSCLKQGPAAYATTMLDCQNNQSTSVLLLISSLPCQTLQALLVNKPLLIPEFAQSWSQIFHYVKVDFNWY